VSLNFISTSTNGPGIDTREIHQGPLLKEIAALQAEVERVSGERDRWKETALTIQRNGDAAHEAERRREWMRGHIDGFWDLGRVLDRTLTQRDEVVEALSNLLDKMADYGSPQGIAVRLSVKRARSVLSRVTP
jgi:hypothetical protein